MLFAIRTLFRTWTPWEEACLDVLFHKAGAKPGAILRAQIESVNMIQRLRAGREINLYVRKHGLIDRAGVPRLFEDGEFTLAVLRTDLGAEIISTRLCCVSGYLFSFESSYPTNCIAFRKDVHVEIAEFDRRFV